jgi:hypothetical protein
VAKTEQHYFRFTPPDQQPGFNPLVGDVKPGCVYEVRPELVDRFTSHPQWTKATKREFDAQLDSPDEE